MLKGSIFKSNNVWLFYTQFFYKSNYSNLTRFNKITLYDKKNNNKLIDEVL